MKKGLFCFLALCGFSMHAFSSCPDLSGAYSFKEREPVVNLKITTRTATGKTIYNFNQSRASGNPWIWESIGDGRSYDKKLNEEHTNVKEKAFCKNNRLYRELTGDWINGDELVPFVVKTEMSNPTPDTFLWKTDFSGYGIHDQHEETYQRDPTL